MVINWKGDTGPVTPPPYDGVAFITDDRGQDGNVHATDGSVILTRDGRSVQCHISGINKCAKKFPDREDSENQGKEKAEQPGIDPTASGPEIASVNVTIGEEWGYDTNYLGLLFCQTTIEHVSHPIKGPCKSFIPGQE